MEKKNNLNKDEKYNNKIINKFINLIMISGKKEKAKNIIYNILKEIKTKYLINPIKIINSIIKKINSEINFKKKKIGGKNYNIPVKINKEKSTSLSIKQILKSAKKRKEKKFEISLYKEIIDTYNGNSETINNLIEKYKKAEQNRAFTNQKK